jgi:hypothetical protein
LFIILDIIDLSTIEVPLDLLFLAKENHDASAHG